jgi:GntR family transcriptional repressor for pyruvate dehydrogenase complex
VRDSGPAPVDKRFKAWSAFDSTERFAPRERVNDMATPEHLIPIKAVASYELVANQIQRAVHIGLLVPGDQLPNERDLARQLGVARMTVREAIRLLAREGRVTVRRGARGGTWIRAQDVDKGELLRLAADADRAIGDVYEFRAIVEGASAGLAAARAQPKDIRKLRSLARAMTKILETHLRHPMSSQVPAFLALDAQFHTEIARIGGNPYIQQATERGLSARYAAVGAVFRALTADSNQGHEELVDAIAKRDSATAEKIMTAHVAVAKSNLITILKRHVREHTGR